MSEAKDFFPISQTERYRLEAKFWKEQKEKHERAHLDSERQFHAYWKQVGDIEELLCSVGGDVEQRTVDAGNVAGVRKLVELYKATQGNGDGR